MAGMAGGLRKASDFAFQFFPAYVAGLFDGFSFDELGDCRTARHCRNAAFGAKTDLGNAFSFQLERELQHVSAGGVFPARGAMRFIQRASIARILKVVK